MNTKPKSAKPAGCTFEQKWGDDPFTALGHTQIPNALIQYASRLKLAPDECWLITCILFFKRSPADPFPGQDTLTAMYGRSVDTIQRVVKSIKAKGLMETKHTRSELGHFDHIVYDFVPLRLALNECYYQDHPEERPKYSRPVPLPGSATPQGCGTADGKGRNISHTARMRYGRNAVSHAAKTPKPIPQGCGTNQTLKKKNELEAEEEFSASLFSGEEEVPAAVASLRWQDLSEAEQQPWLDQARQELEAIHAGSGITPKPKLVQVRAMNLYEISMKGEAKL